MNYSLPGASELAIILGLQRATDDGEPYTSEYTLWARLVGLLSRYDTEARSPDAELGIPAAGRAAAQGRHPVHRQARVRGRGVAWEALNNVHRAVGPILRAHFNAERIVLDTTTK